MKASLLFVELQKLDRNTLSCLRGDLEKLHRAEVSDVRSSSAVEEAIYSKYMHGLETLLDLVCELEGYNRHEPVTVFSFDDLVAATPTLVEMVESFSTDEVTEEPTKRWVTA